MTDCSHSLTAGFFFCTDHFIISALMITHLFDKETRLRVETSVQWVKQTWGPSVLNTGQRETSSDSLWSQEIHTFTAYSFIVCEHLCCAPFTCTGITQGGCKKKRSRSVPFHGEPFKINTCWTVLIMPDVLQSTDHMTSRNLLFIGLACKANICFTFVLNYRIRQRAVIRGAQIWKNRHRQKCVKKWNFVFRTMTSG